MSTGSLHLCILSAFLLFLLTRAAEPHWGYPNLDVDEDFPKWGGLCDSGTRQSPINLSLRGALKGKFEKMEFSNYDDQQSGVVMVNNGHTIQLSNFPHSMELEGGPLLEEYVVEQIHLHWWSEHIIDNVRYPLEAHIVHRNKRYPNMTMALNFKDGITVVGVLYHVSNKRNEAIDGILENLDEVKSYKQLNRPVRMRGSFRVQDLFPKVDGYLTYAGSLTTPSCAEVVTWIVLYDSFAVTMDQVDRFKEIEYESGKHLQNNYRTVQKANNRAVVVVLPDDDDDRDGSDAASSLQVSAITLLLVAISTNILQ